jgi:aspartyl-tRNA synthetase
LSAQGFQEIHTPKLIGGASEGGSSVFKLDYMGQPGCLAGLASLQLATPYTSS